MTKNICQRSETTKNLLLKLWDNTSFDEDTWFMNKRFDVAKKELESADKFIESLEKIILRKKVIRENAMRIIDEINWK